MDEVTAADPPIVIDLYCGLGGWAEGFLAEGYRVIGFDIERHIYGEHRYPGELVIQDVRTLHGSQFRRAAVFVASPPCQEPSYRHMPWTRAKALNEAGPPEQFIALFQECFRIRREASEAAGREIPLIIENVVGAQRWIGRARWHSGSFYLWGDLPALMPIHKPTKQKGSGAEWFDIGIAHLPSASPRRRAASALIAKIPFELSNHIARVYKPNERSRMKTPRDQFAKPPGGWSPVQKQQIAQLQYGYGPITLRRVGDSAVVEIEWNGRIYEVIREDLDGNFCHTIEPIGIEAVIKGEEPA